MSIEIKQKTVDIVFAKKKGKLRGSVDGMGGIKLPAYGEVLTIEETEAAKKFKALRLHFSLMGETSPKLSPLSADFAVDGETTFYRYDWIVGATPFAPFYNKWNWFNKIAKERAMVIQLLIDPNQSGCGYSESNAFLMGLLPSKDTASLFEKNRHKLGDGLDKLAKIAGGLASIPGGVNTIAANVLKTSAVVSNFVVSDDRGIKKWIGMGQKNWFLYRFLDHKRKCCAVEWNVSRNVLHQYGSALRGSILLAFHGIPNPKQPLKLLLRPRLNFGKEVMDYDPPEKELEDKDPVELEIKPLSAQG